MLSSEAVLGGRLSEKDEQWERPTVCGRNGGAHLSARSGITSIGRLYKLSIFSKCVYI